MKAKFIITACATALMAGTVGAKDIEMQAIFPQTLPLLQTGLGYLGQGRYAHRRGHSFRRQEPRRDCRDG